MTTITVILLLVSATCCIGQSGDYCGQKNRLTSFEIRKKFPFDKTETIKLVSFKHEHKVMQESDTIEISVVEPEIPKTNGTVDFSKMLETEALDKNQTEKIINILVNYDNEHGSREVAFCYEPRNGIVFIDKEDKVIGFVEICFECLDYKVEPSTMAVTGFCKEKFEALKSIFKEAGITYGTLRSRD